MWKKLVEKWFDKPVEKIKEGSPFGVRGQRFLDEWLKSYFSETDEMRLSIAVGYSTDAETDEFIGAMIGITLDDYDMIQFSLPEASLLCKFLRFQSKRVESEVNNSEILEGYQEAVEGLVINIEEAMKAAEGYEKATGSVH